MQWPKGLFYRKHSILRWDGGERHTVHFAMGEQCDHGQFGEGKGCVKDSNWEKNGLMRVLLDRESPLYQAVYTRAHRL